MVPATQLAQVDAPGAPSVDVPGAQRAQCVLPSLAANVPGAHGVHVSWPRVLDVPAGHTVQLLAPGAAKVPARQVRHLPSLPSVPAGQAVQEESEVPRWLPAPHGVHPPEEPSARNLPVAQGAQKPEPALGLKVLKPHVMHWEAPPAEYSPAAQAVQSCAPAALTCPARQSRQLVLPAWEAWRPGTHEVHAMVPFSPA